MQIILKAYSVILLGIYFLIWFIPMLVSILIPFRYRLRLVVTPFWSGFSFVTLRLCFFSSIKLVDERSQEMIDSTPLIGALYIANHTSFLDIPLILSRIQIPPLMKKEVMKMPFIGIYGIASGAIPVDRKNSKSRKKVLHLMCERMTSNICTQYYPEGTRSKTGSPKEFEEIKTSLMRFAFENNVPIVPVTMYNTEKLLNRKMKMTTGIPLGLRLGHEIYPKDFENVDDFCRACWFEVKDYYQKFQTILG